MMKRTLIAMATLVGFASAANAASVVITANAATYNPGDLITLTVTGTALSESSTQVFGEILITGTGSVVGSGPTVQAALASFGGALPWTIGGDTTCSNTACIVFNQLLGVTPFPVSNTPLAIGVLQYTAGAAGTVNINFDATDFDFFAAALPAQLSIQVVPEPTTAAMLGLGLFGLAIAGRRRA